MGQLLPQKEQSCRERSITSHTDLYAQKIVQNICGLNPIIRRAIIWGTVYDIASLLTLLTRQCVMKTNSLFYNQSLPFKQDSGLNISSSIETD